MKFECKPLKSWTRISQLFSSRHKGIDLAAPKGTPIYAAADGKVVAAGDGVWDDSYGLHVAIQHGSDYTNYAHMSEINVKAGQTVKAGQKIGEVGSTGNSTGNHLHFEVHDGKKWNRVNPKPYIDAAGSTGGSYTVGKTYTIVAKSGIKVRTGPGTNYRQKKKSELTADGQKHAKDQTMAVLKKGTEVTCKEIKTVSGDTWMKIPSGWICAIEDGDVYVE